MAGFLLRDAFLRANVTNVIKGYRYDLQYALFT